MKMSSSSAYGRRSRMRMCISRPTTASPMQEPTWPHTSLLERTPTTSRPRRQEAGRRPLRRPCVGHSRRGLGHQEGTRWIVDDALARSGPLAVETAGDFPTAPPFTHKLYRALFGSDRIPEPQNQPHHWSTERKLDSSTYRRAFAVQTNKATFTTSTGD